MLASLMLGTVPLEFPMAPARRDVFIAAASVLLAWSPVATADCNVSGNYTIIDTPNDRDSISSCSEIDGALSILFDYAPSEWPEDEASIDLGDVASINGDFVIYPTERTSRTVVTGDNLETIDGELTISVNEVGSTIEEFELSFPALRSVTSNYVITGDFQKLSVTHSDSLSIEGMVRVNDVGAEELSILGVQSVQEDFSIDSNGNLQNLLATLTTAEKSFSISQNSQLTNATFPNLKSVKADITIYQNGALSDLEFSSLETAGTISFTENGESPTLSLPRLSSLGSGNSSSTSHFESVSDVRFSSLRTVNGALAFESTALTDLTIPLIRSLNGSITVEKNPSLTTLALPRVTSVGDIFIKSNDELTNVTANALKSVGTVRMRGSFTNVEFFGLEEVTGDFEVIGADSMDCSWFDANIRDITNGQFSCVGDHDERNREPSTGGIENTEGNPDDYIDSPSSSGDDSSDGDGNSGGNGNGSGGNGGSSGDGGESGESGGGGGGGGLSAGAKAGIGVGAAAAVVLIIFALLFCFLRRKKKQEQQPNSADAAPEMQQVGTPGSHSSTDSDPFNSFAVVGGDAGSSSSSGGGSENHGNRRSVYSGDWGMGVQTTIEAGGRSHSSSASSSASKLGVLKFGRRSLLGNGAKRLSDKSMGPSRTIRRISDPSLAGSQNSNINDDGKASEKSSVNS